MKFKRTEFTAKKLLLTPTMFNTHEDFENVCNQLGVYFNYNKDEDETNVESICCYVLTTVAEYIEEEDKRHPSLTDAERNPSLGKR